MSANVRELVGEIRSHLSNRLKDMYPDMYGAHGFMQTTEPYLVQAMSNVNLGTRYADYYIVRGDGAGPIVVVVDSSAGDDWETLLLTDGLPVRVLRVKSNGAALLAHARDTVFERDLLDVLA